jgi:putative DNA primase/helicase
MSVIEPIGPVLVSPIPDGAPPLPPHREHGQPTHIWDYVNAKGKLLLHVARFDIPAEGAGEKPKKLILPFTLWEQNGRQYWRRQGLDAPRPLYNLDKIMDRADAPVVISEGEKTADAAGRLFPGMVATTSLNGASAVNKTDWSPLEGRHCVVAQDLDDAGTRFRDDVVAALQAAGAVRIDILDVAALAQLVWRDGGKEHRPPEAIPVGYDLADAEEDGWTADRLQAALEGRPDLLKVALLVRQANEAEQTRMLEDPDGLEGRFTTNAEGVWKIVETYDKRAKETTVELIWVCSPLTVCGLTRDSRTSDWGRVVKFRDPDGNEKTLILPMQEFASGGIAILKRLMSHGLVFVPSRAGRDHLFEYLMRSMPKARITHTTKPGWVGESFALPGVSFGPEEIHCDLGEVNHRHVVAGCPQSWREAAALARGNSRLLFALSAAFAGPLVGPLDLEGGGFHLVGKQGDGKTTALLFAGSVWGGGDPKLGYLRSWNGSTAGHEGVAVLANDTFLILDEIGEADPGLIGQIVYMHRNGSGRNRSDLMGRLMASASFCCFTMSTGEKTVAQAISDNARGLKPMAGQLIRLLDLPADAGAGMGVFENLHRFKNARALAQHLRAMALHHHGHAARQFLTKLTADLDEARVIVFTMIEDFVEEHCPEGFSPQIARAAAQFGLVAAAGELAAAYDVLPFSEGEAMAAAKVCFAAWLAGQDDHRYAREYLEAIRTVQRFVSLHGTGRFEILKPARTTSEAELDRPTHNRAGYRKIVQGGMQHIVLPEVWNSEVCKGLPPDYVLSCLRSEGLLDLGENGRTAKKVRVPDQDRPIRAYVLKPGLLSWPGGDEAEDPRDVEEATEEAR